MTSQQHSRPSDSIQRPSCPNYGKPMWLARIARYGSDCIKRTFECPVRLYQDDTVVNCRRSVDSPDLPLPGGSEINGRLGFQRQISKPILYVSVIGIALIGIALGLTAVAKVATELSQQTQRERTLLDLRMESSRQIRQALAKPVPQPEPLPPITDRARHAVGSAAAGTTYLDRRKLMDEARDVFASPHWLSSSARSSAYAEFDPHAVR